jgi:hypothetical protein
MIIQFPNGAAIDSSVIAGIYVDTHSKSIQVYVFRSDGFSLNPWAKPAASHLMSVKGYDTEEEAVAECRRLTAEWIGKPCSTVNAAAEPRHD